MHMQLRRPGWIIGAAALVLVTVVVTRQFCVSPQAQVIPQQEVMGEKTWTLRSQHFIYGMPATTDQRYNFALEDNTPATGISVLVREGFVVGHCDKFKIPLWVCVKWTRADYNATEGKPSPRRNFKADLELPAYARATPNYHGPVKMDRGHMARNQDNLAWGEDNASTGNLMSNIAPQSPSLNEHAWLALENLHRNVVKSGEIDAIWIITGTVLKDGKAEATLNNGVGVPYGTFKVLAWYDRNDNLHARGFVLSQDANQATPERYMVPIRQIEEMTGLNFFPELPYAEQNRIETANPRKVWVD
jgi:endonuclease G